jgi:hypothetical protein
MSESGELLTVFWRTIKEYIPAKDRQVAADHVVNELVDAGITDNDLQELAVDRIMQAAISEHVEVEDTDEDIEE